jgi:hypothetical protein
MLVTASLQYGLTTGSNKSPTLSLGDFGRRIVIEGDAEAMVDAFLNVPLFRKFYEKYSNNVVPSAVPAKSFLAENGIPAARTDACLAVLTESAQQCGLIQRIGQTDRIVSRDRAIQGAAKPAVGPAADRDSLAESDQVDEEKEPRRQIQRMPSMHFNVEVHLPPDATAETYDAIFSSMRKHLIDADE